MYFWEINVEKRERICPEFNSKMPFFFFFNNYLRASRGIYNDFVTLQLRWPLSLVTA